MKKIITACLVFSLAFLLNGCVLFHGFAPPVQQGNVISVAKVDQLHLGMSKAQVEALMGSPVHTSTFNNNRFDYVYTYQKPFRAMHTKIVIVSFSNGAVSNIQKNLSILPARYKKF